MPLEHLRELTPVVLLLTFEHLKIQQLAVFKQPDSSPRTFPFLYILFSLSTPNTLFFAHICICVFILESHYFTKFIAASQLKRSNVLKSQTCLKKLKFRA